MKKCIGVLSFAFGWLLIIRGIIFSIMLGYVIYLDLQPGFVNSVREELNLLRNSMVQDIMVSCAIGVALIFLSARLGMTLAGLKVFFWWTKSRSK